MTEHTEHTEHTERAEPPERTNHANRADHGYRHALTRPGVGSFTSAGALARLPVAMIALAIVLLVSNTTGSYAYAGALSAAFAVTAALASIVTSRWADRIGQTPVLRVLATLHSALLIAFTTAVVLDTWRLVQAVLVIAAGATSPAIGSYVRARWSFVADGPGTLRVGFAWESILDELIFTVGPVITTVIAFNVGFPAPLILAAAFILIGSWWLSGSKRSTPPVNHHAERGASLWVVARTRGLTALIVAALGLGLLFGALDVATVAFTAERGSGEVAGFVLAGFAAASMVGGIIYGMRPWPGALHRHTQAAAVVLAAVSATFWLVDSNIALIIVAMAAGASVAPTLIGIFSLAQRLVEPRNLTEGLTWTNSGLAAGFAFGSALSGVLVDTFGSRAGLGLCAAGAFLAAIVLAARNTSIAAPPRDDSVVSTPAAWNDDPLPGPHPGA